LFTSDVVNKKQSGIMFTKWSFLLL